jgi:hypothetical protein
MDIYDNPYRLAGMIQEAAYKAAQKELKKQCEKQGYDSAFWHISITTDLSQLSENFKSVVQSIQIKKTADWNLPRGENDSQDD